MADEKPQGKQTSSRRSKFNMIALWTAIATALGSQGIPKIVQLLENKPSVEQVQVMIANQTESLTKLHNENVDATKALASRLIEAQKEIAALKLDLARALGHYGFIEEVLRGCCVKTAAAIKPIPVAAPPAEPDLTEIKRTKDIKAKFQKADSFSAQQALDGF